MRFESIRQSLQANKNPVKTVSCLDGVLRSGSDLFSLGGFGGIHLCQEFFDADQLHHAGEHIHCQLQVAASREGGGNAVLTRSGYFATASCNHFMPSDQFMRMLRSAALDAGVELRQIEARRQAPDHPILWNVPETDYLKFYLFQVM